MSKMFQVANHTRVAMQKNKPSNGSRSRPQERLRSLVEQVFEAIDELDPTLVSSATRVSDEVIGEKVLTRRTWAPLPDPKLIRQIIRQRCLRSEFLGGDWFADPAWDILLDLTAAAAENKRVSVSSLCHASGVPPTTALRWISQMVDGGLLVRVDDPVDRRRSFIELSDVATRKMARYFAETGVPLV